MNDLGMGVVGLGRLGRTHAQNILETARARLVAVCDTQPDLARSVAADLGCACYSDIRRMLENREIDAVLIVTPTALHGEPVTAAAEAGKPIFCEKPLAGSLDETRQLISVIRGSQIKCQVGFQRRYDPSYVEAEKMIRDQCIGNPVYVSGCSRDPFPAPPWAMDSSKGGGLYIDFLLHDFDMARFLLRDEVETVYADDANLVVDSQGIESFADNAVVMLHFKGGALATFHASMHAEYGYDIRTEVHGSKGSVMIGGLHRAEVTLCTLDRGISRPHTYHQDGDVPHFVVRFKEAYRSELAAFVDCVLDNSAPRVTEDDALQALRIAVAAGDSARQKRPVPLSDY